MTGYESKRAAAQDKVTDIDGHVVRDVRKPRKPPQRTWVEPPAISIWRQPVYQPPKMDTPRPGAHDHLQIRSRGV